MPPRLLDEPCDEYGGACIESDLRGDERHVRVRRHAGRVRRPVVVRLRGRWRASPTSTRRCRACTSAGRRGAPWRCGRCCAGAGSASLVFLYPLATLFCIIVTANHYWIDGVGGLFCFAVGTLAGWGLHRWNQHRLDRKSPPSSSAAARARRDDRRRPVGGPAPPRPAGGVAGPTRAARASAARVTGVRYAPSTDRSGSGRSSRCSSRRRS